MNTSPHKSYYLTVTQAAARLGVDVATVRRWIDAGWFHNVIRTSPKSGSYRIPVKSIEQFEKAREL